jgi:aldehyde:ferredoxin oxidoreductase
MYGNYGRVLHIDLHTRSIETFSPPEAVYAAHLGGRGLATWLLLEKNPPGIDPFDPANLLIFATGPATGTGIWGSSRYGVFTKSPQTGLFSESYSGGKVPQAVAATGYDAVIISGKSETPVILAITPENVAFHEAGDTWGKDTYATQDEVQARFAGSRWKKTGVVSIGPAGENRVTFAVIENDRWRSAGRTGTGAVMGSKNLKALFFAGDRQKKPENPDAVKAFIKQTRFRTTDHPAVIGYKTKGTPAMVRIAHSAGAFPYRYWSREPAPSIENISAEALHEQCRVKPKACSKCFMACSRMTHVETGRHAGLQIEGPEYETIYAFGGLCCVDDIREIAWLNDICDRLGMDTMSAGNLCGLTIEASRRKKIDFAIDYGQADPIADLLHLIAARQGIGDILAKGIKHAAAEWGLEDIAIHVKGLEPAGYDPRALKGMGLAYATAGRGACHMRGTILRAELTGMIEPDEIKGKAELYVDFEDRHTIFDCLVLCRFYRDLYPWDEMRTLIEALTGLDRDQASLEKIAADITTMVRQFNLREGMDPAEDKLPSRLYKEALTTGQAISEADLNYMLQDYYKLRGWNSRGIPD